MLHYFFTSLTYIKICVVNFLLYNPWWPSWIFMQKTVKKLRLNVCPPLIVLKMVQSTNMPNFKNLAQNALTNGIGWVSQPTTRTTNGCKSYHNSLFYSKHKNIFTFIE